MPSAPLVSVVLPVWNPAPDLFPLAVVSVVCQTLTDWELIVVEDPSKRSAGPLLAAFGDPRIRHVANPARTSFAEQLNLGLSLARSEFVARMDADDLCEPHRLATQLAFLRSHPEVALVGSNLTVIDQRGRKLGERRYPASHDQIVRALPRFNPIAHPAVMFRKSPALAAGGYRADMYTADYDLWNRLHGRGYRLANLQEPLLRYRVHPEGMKSARLKEMLRATLAIKRSYWHGRMDLGSRLRMAAEQLLLLLPAQVVLRMFLLTHVRPQAA
jgi:glycosyltransferase involved in cell wall biosynthesis